MRFNVPGSISVLNAVKTFERVKRAANDQQQAANQPTAKTIPAPSQPVNPATTQQPLQQPGTQITTPAPAQPAATQPQPQQQVQPQPQPQPQQQVPQPQPQPQPQSQQQVPQPQPQPQQQQQAVTTPPPLPGSGLEFAGQIPTTGDRELYQELYNFYTNNQRKPSGVLQNEQKFRVETATGGTTQEIKAPDQYLIAGITMRKDGAYALDEYLKETDAEKKRQLFEKLPEDLKNSLVWVDDLKRNANFDDPKTLVSLIQDKEGMKKFRTLWEYGLVNTITKAPDGSRLDPNDPEQYKQIVGNFSNIMSKALDDNSLTVADLNLLYKNFVLDLGLDPDDPNSAAAFQSWRENTKKDPDNSFQTLALFFGIPLVIGGLASVLSGNFGFLPVLGLIFGGLGMFYGLGGMSAFGQTQASTQPPEMYLNAPEIGPEPLYDVHAEIRNKNTGGMTFDTSDTTFMLPSSFYNYVISRPVKESPGKKFTNLTAQVGVPDFQAARGILASSAEFKLKDNVSKPIKDLTFGELIDHLKWRANNNLNVPLSDQEKQIVAAVAQLALSRIQAGDRDGRDSRNQVYQMVIPLLEDNADVSPEQRKQILESTASQLLNNDQVQKYLNTSFGWLNTLLNFA